MPEVCQDMHKCHNYHAILHKLYMWFGKNELRLYLNRAKCAHGRREEAVFGRRNQPKK